MARTCETSKTWQASVFKRINSLKDLIYLFVNDNIQVTFQRYLSLILSYFVWTSFASFSEFELKIHPPLAYVICFLWVDFATYLYHYSFHRFNFLWRFHEMHHSPRTMTWLAGHRNFWFENIVYDLFTGICFLFIPLPPILGISREFHDTIWDRLILPFLPRRVVKALESFQQKFLSLLLK